MKTYSKAVLKVFVSAILLGVIFINLDKSEFITSISLMQRSYIPFIVILLILNYVVSSVRWKALIVQQNAQSVTLPFLTKLYFIGAFFNNFMPTSIGGDVYKIIKLGKKLNNNAAAFSATFMERFAGVLVLVLISVISLIDILKIWGVLIFIGFWLTLILGYFLIAFLSTKQTKIKKVYDALNFYNKSYKVLAFAFFSSLVVQLLAIFTQYLVFKAIGITLPLTYALSVLPLITLAGFFVPSLNGVGVQDALYMQLFSVIGIPTTLSLSASVLYHIFRLGVSLIGGIFYAFDKNP